jgi:hypothetical protein
MSDSSLVPERQLVFSPALAATVGLEEAILLQHLQALFEQRTPQLRDGFAWLAVEWAYLLHTLPFWSATDLQRIIGSLANLGVLLLEAPAPKGSDRLVFALNETTNRPGKSPSPGAAADPYPARAPTAGNPASPPATVLPRRGAALLPCHWVPSEDLLQLLALNHNIPRQFALDQLEDFIFYWRERGETSHAWENKFRQHVTSNWRRHQQHQAEAFREPVAPLDNAWRPSADALEILQRDEVDPAFIDQAIPEFILYWRERGAAPPELNTKFLQHIRIQWARYSSGLEHSTEPKRISPDWAPSADVFDILRMSHIDAGFARDLVPEFIVYWRDSNQAQTSWNSKFLQHVKYHWAKRHQIEQTGHSNAGQQGTNPTGRTRDRSLQDDLTDTSWAE